MIKIISLILSVFLLIFSFVGCNKDVVNSEKVTEQVSDSLQSTSNSNVIKTDVITDVSEDIDINPQPENVVLSANWMDYTVEINGIVIVLPIQFKEFCDKTGCSFEDETDRVKVVSPYSEEYIDVFVNKDNDIEVGLYLYNPTNNNLTAEECIVIGLRDSTQQYLSDTSGVLFACGLHAGGYTSQEELVELFGEPQTKSDDKYTNGEFRYIYFENEAYGKNGADKTLNINVGSDGKIISIYTKTTLD